MASLRLLDCKCPGCSNWQIIEDAARQMSVGGRHAVILECWSCGAKYPATLAFEASDKLRYVDGMEEPSYIGVIPPAPVPHAPISEPSTDPVTAPVRVPHALITDPSTDPKPAVTAVTSTDNIPPTVTSAPRDTETLTAAEVGTLDPAILT